MATSSIPDFKAALETALTALAGLSGVTVAYGIPTRNPQKEMVILSDVQDWDQVPAAMKNPGHPREETYDLEFFVRVEQGGHDQQVVTERAFAILDAIEDYLRTAPAYSITANVRNAQFMGGSLEEFPGTDAQLALITGRIYVEARI